MDNLIREQLRFDSIIDNRDIEILYDTSAADITPNNRQRNVYRTMLTNMKYSLS